MEYCAIALNSHIALDEDKSEQCLHCSRACSICALKQYFSGSHEDSSSVGGGVLFSLSFGSLKV